MDGLTRDSLHIDAFLVSDVCRPDPTLAACAHFETAQTRYTVTEQWWDEGYRRNSYHACKGCVPAISKFYD